MKKVIVIFIALSFALAAKSQSSSVQAMFIYNFTKLIDWPAEYKSGKFVIGVVGNSPVLNDLQKISASKTVGSQSIEVVQYSNAALVGNCHIVFVSADQSSNISIISSKSAGKSTLIISEKEGLIAHSGINFVIKSSKMAFELNKTNLAERNLKVSSQLSELAIVVK